MAETRKLAAILAADVVGQSRLAGGDEEWMLARLLALRSDLIDPTIALHNGRVVKRMGDGVVVEFRSAVNALRCATEIQNGMADATLASRPSAFISALGFISATSSRRPMATSRATASLLPRGWKAFANPGVFVSPAPPTNKCGTA